MESTQVHTYTHKKGIQVHTYTHKKGIQVHTYTHTRRAYRYIHTHTRRVYRYIHTHTQEGYTQYLRTSTTTHAFIPLIGVPWEEEEYIRDSILHSIRIIRHSIS